MSHEGIFSHDEYPSTLSTPEKSDSYISVFRSRPIQKENINGVNPKVTSMFYSNSNSCSIRGIASLEPLWTALRNRCLPATKRLYMENCQRRLPFLRRRTAFRYALRLEEASTAPCKQFPRRPTAYPRSLDASLTLLGMQLKGLCGQHYCPGHATTRQRGQ